MRPDSEIFIIRRKYSAYSVVLTGLEVIIEPHYDEVRTFATTNIALGLEDLSRVVLTLRSQPDPCEFLLEFYARNGWRIEEAETEDFQAEL